MNYLGNIYLGEPPHTVWIDNVCLPGKVLLDPRNDLIDHSPTGYSWGYDGSGPAQLALAILAHEFFDEVALRHYQWFKTNVIAQFKKDQTFVLKSGQVKQIMPQIGKNGPWA